jgi:hypothetical protein
MATTEDEEIELYRCKEGTAFEIDGQPVWLQPGQIARRGARVLRERPTLFEPLPITYEAEPSPAKRGAVASARADLQGARAR